MTLNSIKGFVGLQSLIFAEVLCGQRMKISHKNNRSHFFRALREGFYFYSSLLAVFFFFSFTIPLLFSFIPTLAASSTGELEEIKHDEGIVIGTGIIVGENISEARNSAINSGFLKGVENYLIGKLGLKSVADNLQMLDEEILSRAKDGIQDYQIVSEFQTGRYVKVLMKVRVNRALLDKSLESLGFLESDNPKADVLFMVSEKQSDFPPAYWWHEPFSQISLTQTELSLIRLFEDKGFRVINKSFYAPGEDYDDSMLRMHLSNEDAVKWGKIFSADMVITGGANLYGDSWASIFLKALRVNDGLVLAQGYREAALADNHEDERTAVGLAIDSWARDMISYVLNGIEPAKGSINTIEIVLEGLTDYRGFIDFKQFLSTNFPEIRFLLEKRLKKESITLSLNLSTNSNTLAKKIQNLPDKPFSCEIDDLNEQGFTLTIK